MVKYIIGVLALVGLFSISIFAQNNLLNEKRPRIVVGITIDHVSNDFIQRYWSTFQNGGFKRIVSYGAYTEKARLDIHNLKPSTGMATISTGVYPSVHGIVGDEWFKQLTAETKYAAKDDYYLTMGSDSKEGNVSANNLKVFNLGDVVKSSTNFKGKVYAVSLNATTAVLAAGHSADGAYWLDKTNGNMISSSYYLDKFPNWVLDFNLKKLPETYLNRSWDLLLPKGSYTSGFVDDYVLEKGFWGKWNTFPYKLEKLASASEFKYDLLKATPFGNKLLRDFAIQLIDQEKLGDDENTDLLTINFSTLDFANQWFEPNSVEIQDLYLRLDQDIAGILNYLDKIMGKDNYLVYFTANSTSSFSTSVLKDEFNFPAGDFSPESAMALLRSYLNAIYGVGDWIERYNEEQIYLNHKLIDKKEKPLDEMQLKAALFINQFEGLRSAIPAHVIETSNVENKRFIQIENSYCVQRSGDVIIQLEEGWKPKYKYHEHYYSTNNFIPVIFYGSFVKPGKIIEKVNATDIVPTVCRFLNILPPDDVSGIAIEKVFW